MTWFEVLVLFGLTILVAVEVYGIAVMTNSLDRIERILRERIS